MVVEINMFLKIYYLLVRH